MIMAEKLGLKDGKSYELKLGKSFQSGSGVAFHSMRCRSIMPIIISFRLTLIVHFMIALRA